MDTQKKSRFEYEEKDGKHYVTLVKEGIRAEIYKDDNNWRARNFENLHESDKHRLIPLGKEMANWFYYRIIKSR